MALFLFRTSSLILSVIIISASIALRYECDQRNVSCGCGFKNVDVNNGMFHLEEAVPHSWSMIVSIQYDCHQKKLPSTHCCTGTILNDRYVLTSASCFDRQMNKTALADDVTIVAGIHSLNQPCSVKQKVDSIQIHPQWTTERNDSHDLALIRLSTRFDFTNDFLLSRTCRANSLSNTTLAVVGWNVSDDFDAEKSHFVKQMAFYSNNLNTSDSLWHLHHPTANCFHENGTALFQWLGDRWELIGIQSFAMNICSSNNYHGIFTPVASFSTWIHSILNDNQTTTLPTPTRSPTTVPSFHVYPCNRSFTCGCSYSNVRFSSQDSEQIEYAASNSWSMVVSLRKNRDGEHFCTGTLLSESFVLTTAHCAQSVPLANISVFAGATNLSDGSASRRTVKTITIYPDHQFSPETMHNIAVLQLQRPFTFKDNPILSRICIENPNKSLPVNELTPVNGSRIVAVSWDSVRLRNISQSLLALEQLHMYVQDHRNAGCEIDRNRTTSQFCAGQSSITDTNICLNDRGLAIFNWTGHYWQQVGILASHFNCSRPGLPNPYIRLSYYWPWIESILNRDNETLDTGFLIPTTTTTTVSTTRFIRTTITSTSNDTNIGNTSTTELPSNASTMTSWPSINTTQNNQNISFLTTTTDWTLTNASNVNNSSTISTSTFIPSNSTQSTTNASSIAPSTTTVARPLSTTTTTMKKPETWYVCNRLPDRCGCSMNDVILTDGHEENENIRPRSWSMIVAVQSNAGRYLCSGTILSEFYILTSARCVSNPLVNNNMSIVAGSDYLWINGTSVRQVERIIIHESYNGNVSSVHDIAILKLSEALDINRRPLFSISKICLPNSGRVDSMSNGRLMSVGWKRSSLPSSEPNFLQQVPISMINNPNTTCFNSTYANTYQFCAGISNQNRNLCTDHFGEPLFIYRDKYWEQVGILSESHQCGQMVYSGVYIRLSAYMDWIQTNMADTVLPTRQTPISESTTIYTHATGFLLSIILLTLNILSSNSID